MPDPDGWTVLRSLKEDRELCEIPVILATVLGDREMGLALGAAEHLTKPIDPADLIRVLSRVVLRNGNIDVLVVDDDAGTREMLRRTLTREGWSVREAEDGSTGLEEVARSRPAVILLDGDAANGRFKCWRRQKERADARCAVIIVTSKTSRAKSARGWKQCMRSSRRAGMSVRSWSKH